MIKLTIYVPAGLGRRAALVVQRLHEQGRLTQGGGTGTSTSCVSFSVFCLFSVFCVYWIHTRVSLLLYKANISREEKIPIVDPRPLRTIVKDC